MGSIPACAGEPGRDVDPAIVSRVYPRVCGGARMRMTLHAGVKGLSPRVRGSRGRVVLTGGDPGSIPACAGEPPGRWSFG